MAREIGRALPIAQYDAFADGVINFEEVQTAADRLRACASEGGVASFATSVTEDGFESSHNGAEGDAVVIERCKTSTSAQPSMCSRCSTSPSPEGRPIGTYGREERVGPNAQKAGHGRCAPKRLVPLSSVR
jgi:hypothetical protein